MKLRTLGLLASLVTLASATGLAQDPVKTDPAHYKVLVDNASVRILKVDYPAGAKGTMHQHPDTIVVSLGPSKAQFAMPDGKTVDQELAAESAMFIPGGLHQPTNVGKTPVDAIVVEFKAAKPGTAAIPTNRPELALKMLVESPRAVAYRVTAEPTFAEEAGTKHEYDQVVIALTPAKMALSIDGKPARSDWKRGDVQFIGRGTPHEAKNTSGKPADYIIVAIK